MKKIFDVKKWNLVANELQSEDLKLASYDRTLIPRLGELRGKTVLDYGCGPGVLALALKRLGANVKVFDISDDMLKLAGDKIEHENIFNDLSDIPKNNFDIVICNLVLCIVDENEVRNIIMNIKILLKENGVAYIGFCNPKIFNILESQLDFRFPTGNKYEDNHSYKKLKREGNYEIIESHRPVEWYSNIYATSGLEIEDITFTPSYELKGNKIEDFVIFKLINRSKNGAR